MRFFLYDEPAAKALRTGTLAEYLRARFPAAEVAVRDAFHQHFLPGREPARAEWLQRLAAHWARAKVIQPDQAVRPREPLSGEVSYERRRLGNAAAKAVGIVYDGLLLQSACREIIPQEESRLSAVHLVLTRQLLATYDEGDLRYHLRVLIGGQPSLLSTTGLVEAPARPREYYVEQALHRTLTGPAFRELAAHSDGGGRYLRPDDPRTTEALKGYLLQAIVYQLTGEAFCGDPKCRLFNAHWQEELIEAQLGEGAELCRRHEGLLASIGSRPLP